MFECLWKGQLSKEEMDKIAYCPSGTPCRFASMDKNSLKRLFNSRWFIACRPERPDNAVDSATDLNGLATPRSPQPKTPLFADCARHRHPWLHLNAAQLKRYLPFRLPMAASAQTLLRQLSICCEDVPDGDSIQLLVHGTWRKDGGDAGDW